ncbi:hypothetical protein M422DRAFT_247709 [Sphaerobolus stellatus SS14]|nr:hypothetical protein M422DRAFT_247709 [Sphaerobolus stellatus SS14]
MLAGIVVGMDSTVKAAKKANMYYQEDGSKKLIISNVFDGGLLTIVNADFELVSWCFLFTNSILEVIAPILEYGERNAMLGIRFNEEGEVCVDRCCNFKGTIALANPNLSVPQDLMHLVGHILATISKQSPYHPLVAFGLSKALVKKRSDGKGSPAEYFDSDTQAKNLEAVYKKFKCLGDVWTKEHPHIPSHTFGNENWHGHINALTCGDASSLPTILLLISDMVLWHNLRLKLRNFSQPVDSPSRQFRAATLGSPHLYLIDGLLREMEKLTGIPQPQFLDIHPEHQFGLVPLKQEYMHPSFDHYKQMEADIQAQMVIKDEDAEWQFLSTSFNGAADELLDPKALSPKPSIALARRGKRKADCDTPRPLDNDGLWPPAKQRRSESDMTSTETRRVLPGQPQSQQSFVMQQSIVHSNTVISTVGLPINDFCVDDLCIDVAKCNGFYLHQAANWPIFQRKTQPTEPHAEVDPSLTYTSSATFINPYPPLPTPPSSSHVDTTSGTTSQRKESHSMAIFSTLTSTTSATDVIQSQEVSKNSGGHWRFCTFRLEYGWTSRLTDKQWQQAADKYNDPNVTLSSQNYSSRGLPKDPIQRDGLQGQKQMGHELSSWILMQLTLKIPGGSVYNKPTKTGKAGKRKKCQCCQAYKDGEGIGRGHPLYTFLDEVLSWKQLPYPVATFSIMVVQNDPIHKGTGRPKKVFSPVACVDVFRKAARAEYEARAQSKPVDMAIQNTLRLEEMARADSTVSREEAIQTEVLAYNFNKSMFD